VKRALFPLFYLARLAEYRCHAWAVRMARLDVRKRVG
jgi:hypothetical protein